MAGQRDLEPAAERGAVDRGDHRLGAVLDVSTTIGSIGICIGLPNSEMSAPAKKVWPWQRITTAFTASSASASSIAFTSPSRTAWPSAFTGGLFETTIEDVAVAAGW